MPINNGLIVVLGSGVTLDSDALGKVFIRLSGSTLRSWARRSGIDCVLTTRILPNLEMQRSCLPTGTGEERQIFFDQLGIVKLKLTREKRPKEHNQSVKDSPKGRVAKGVVLRGWKFRNPLT
jgi:hypothetical protein